MSSGKRSCLQGFKDFSKRVECWKNLQKPMLSRLLSSFMEFYFHNRVCIGKVTPKISICKFTRILNYTAKLQLVINADSLNVRNLLLLGGPLSQIHKVSLGLTVVDTL